MSETTPTFDGKETFSPEVVAKAQELFGYSAQEAPEALRAIQAIAKKKSPTKANIEKLHAAYTEQTLQDFNAKKFSTIPNALNEAVVIAQKIGIKDYTALNNFIQACPDMFWGMFAHEGNFKQLQQYVDTEMLPQEINNFINQALNVEKLKAFDWGKHAADHAFTRTVSNELNVQMVQKTLFSTAEKGIQDALEVEELHALVQHKIIPSNYRELIEAALTLGFKPKASVASEAGGSFFDTLGNEAAPLEQTTKPVEQITTTVERNLTEDELAVEAILKRVAEKNSTYPKTLQELTDGKQLIEMAEKALVNETEFGAISNAAHAFQYNIQDSSISDSFYGLKFPFAKYEEAHKKLLDAGTKELQKLADDYLEKHPKVNTAEPGVETEELTETAINTTEKNAAEWGEEVKNIKGRLWPELQNNGYEDLGHYLPFEHEKWEAQEWDALISLVNDGVIPKITQADLDSLKAHGEKLSTLKKTAQNLFEAKLNDNEVSNTFHALIAGRNSYPGSSLSKETKFTLFSTKEELAILFEKNCIDEKTLKAFIDYFTFDMPINSNYYAVFLEKSGDELKQTIHQFYTDHHCAVYFTNSQKELKEFLENEAAKTAEEIFATEGEAVGNTLKTSAEWGEEVTKTIVPDEDRFLNLVKSYLEDHTKDHYTAINEKQMHEHLLKAYGDESNFVLNFENIETQTGEILERILKQAKATYKNYDTIPNHLKSRSSDLRGSYIAQLLDEQLIDEKEAKILAFDVLDCHPAESDAQLFFKYSGETLKSHLEDFYALQEKTWNIRKNFRNKNNPLEDILAEDITKVTSDQWNEIEKLVQDGAIADVTLEDFKAVKAHAESLRKSSHAVEEVVTTTLEKTVGNTIETSAETLEAKVEALVNRLTKDQKDYAVRGKNPDKDKWNAILELGIQGDGDKVHIKYIAKPKAIAAAYKHNIITKDEAKFFAEYCGTNLSKEGFGIFLGDKADATFAKLDAEILHANTTNTKMKLNNSSYKEHEETTLNELQKKPVKNDVFTSQPNPVEEKPGFFKNIWDKFSDWREGKDTAPAPKNEITPKTTTQTSTGHSSSYSPSHSYTPPAEVSGSQFDKAVDFLFHEHGGKTALAATVIGLGALAYEGTVENRRQQAVQQ